MQDNNENQLIHPLNGSIEQRILQDLLFILNNEQMHEHKISSRAIEIATMLKNKDANFLSCFDEIPEATPNSIVSLLCFARQWDAAAELLIEPTRSIGSALLSMIYIVDHSSPEKVNRALPMIKAIMDHPCFDVNFANTNGEAALYLACKFNAIDIVDLLLKTDDIDINLHENINGNTPLMIAIGGRNFEIALGLLQCTDLQLEKKNASQKTAISLFSRLITESVVMNQVSDHERLPLIQIMKVLMVQKPGLYKRENCLDQVEHASAKTNYETQNSPDVSKPSDAVNEMNEKKEQALTGFLNTVEKRKKLKKSFRESIAGFKTILDKNLIENIHIQIGELAYEIKENPKKVSKKNSHARQQINTKVTQTLNKATAILADYKKILIPIKTAFNASTDALERYRKAKGKTLERLQKAHDEFNEKNTIFNEQYSIIQIEIEKQLSVILDLKIALAALFLPVNTKKSAQRNRKILKKSKTQHKLNKSLVHNPSSNSEETPSLNKDS